MPDIDRYEGLNEDDEEFIFLDSEDALAERYQDEWVVPSFEEVKERLDNYHGEERDKQKSEKENKLSELVDELAEIQRTIKENLEHRTQLLRLITIMCDKVPESSGGHHANKIVDALNYRITVSAAKTTIQVDDKSQLPPGCTKVVPDTAALQRHFLSTGKLPDGTSTGQGHRTIKISTRNQSDENGDLIPF